MSKQQVRRRMWSIKSVTISGVLSIALSSACLPCFAATDMAVLQESKPLITRAGAWHTWKDRFHLHPGQEKLPLHLTFSNGADGRPKATDLVVELDGAPLASFKDFKGGDSFTIDLTGKIHNNTRLKVKGFGPSGARMNWRLFVQKPAISSVSPKPISLNDTIKITGSNFSNRADQIVVHLGKKHIKILSAGPNEINGKISGHAEGGNQDLIASVASVKSDPFKVSVRSHPRITWVNMLASAPREPVTINGSGFSSVPAENIVTVGKFKARVTAATETSISFIIPEMPFPKWHTPIKVTSNGMPCKGHASINIDVRVVPNEGIPMR